MYIPVFEIKDSFIVKHKLQYNTSCGDLPFKIMFTDYDLARKSQTTNAENFSGVTLDVNLSGITLINVKYFNEEFNIHLDGDVIHEDDYNSSNVINNTNFQEYYVPNGSLFFDKNERVDVEIYQKDTQSGTTIYEHFSYVPNDIWFVSGSTEKGNQWIVSGTTSDTGYTSGYTNWYIEEITPILFYISDVISTGNTYIRLNNKIEDYLYNNLINNYTNLYYKVISLNHCNQNYIDLYDKVIKIPTSKFFDISVTLNTLTLEPIYNKDDIYYNYDALTITASGSTSYVYNFDTACLYNKYDLLKFFEQLGYGYNAAIYNGYTTNAVEVSTGYTYGDYYMSMEVPITDDFKEYTYAEILTNSGNTYNVIISSVTGTTIQIITPLNYLNGEDVLEITNIWRVGDISYVLQKTYENYEQDEYRKHHIQIQKKIYNSYAEIINKDEINQEVRLFISGLIYENKNKIMVLKVFDPADYIDDRLLYEPIEIVRIGKDKKTSIPVTIKSFTKGLAADVIDENIYSVYLFNPNIEDVLVIDSNAT